MIAPAHRTGSVAVFARRRGGFALALVAALAVGCGKADEAPKGGGGPKGPLVVRVATVKKERVPRTVELTGTLGGDEEVVLAAEVEGKVVKIEADLGDLVKAGAPIVRLADEELRLRVELAEAEYLTALARLGANADALDQFQPDLYANVKKAGADLEDATRTLDRVRQLREKDLASEGELDAARTRVTMLAAALEGAREEAKGAYAAAKAKRASLGLAKKELRDATIVSPVTGVVAKRMVALGDLVKQGQQVAQIVVQDPLKLRGEVPERYSGLVVAGMPVSLKIEATGASAEGKISRVGPVVAAASRTFPVEAQIDNANGALRAGVFAEASVVVGEDEEVVAVPETAVSALAGVTKIFVEEGGKAVEKRVTVLRKRGDQALVVGDLKEGDRVILTAVSRLFPGADVKVDAAPPGAGVPQEARRPGGPT